MNDSGRNLDPSLQRSLERLGLANDHDRWTERYLLNEQLVDPMIATPTERFTATCRLIRHLVAQRSVKT